MTPYNTNLPPHLRSLKEEIEGYARDYGLDFYETIFEVIDGDDLNEIAAYGGFPTRYPHWSFGMQYEELRKGYDYGLSKIYEMVINNDPCYAYLMLIGKKGKDLVSIPLPQIDIPQFRYGTKGSGGVGQGDGDVGTPLSPPQGSDKGGAGDQPGGHILEVELTMEEMAQILGEELALPRIEPRGKKNIITTRDRYTGIRQTGPESLRHFKRTFKRALRRQIASQVYDPEQPIVVPVREDKQYRSWKEVHLPQSVAVLIYMMDVSGSMTDEQKEIVRIEAFWIDTWIKAHYKGVETVYIIHDAAAQEVDEHTFYHTRESGGTKISSAYELALKIIKARYSPTEWNIYAFHFSDGDNWGDDVPHCIDLLNEQLLPAVNLFGYGQVESPYGSGEFFDHIHDQLGERDNVVCSRIPDREAILDSIKEFLGTGR